MDTTTLPLDSLLDLIYYWMTMNREEEEVQRIDADLWLPPADPKAVVPKDSPWSDEAMLASMAALSATPGGAVL